MTYRELPMIDVKEVLRRWRAGHSNRRIARETGIDRDTAGRYIAIAKELALPSDRDLTEAEVHEIAQRVQARPLPDRSAEWIEIAKHKERIVEWLERKRPLRLSKIHVLLQRDGIEASYGTLRRYAMQELGWHKKAPTVRLEDPPAGQEAQVDFGQMGRLLDVETGRQRMLWVLVITLSLSRYQFVWPTFSQSTEAVCEGLDRAWWFFGAMPRTILPDNTRAMIKDPDALNPVLVAAFLDYVQARGIFVDPARIRSPKDKARVENQVPYVRESWFDGETFTDLADARRSAEHWAREIAGARVHGTTRQVPREQFALLEKAAMLAAPTELFDVPLWVDGAKVHPDHHIQVAHALYSGAHGVLAQEGASSCRQDDGSDLLRYGADQGASPKGAGRSLDRHWRLSRRQGSVRFAERGCARSEGKGERSPRRHVRRAHRRRAVAVDAHASSLRASSALRQIRRGTRRGGLPERARLRRRRRRAHHADAQVGHQATDVRGQWQKGQARAAHAAPLRSF
jgi:transposase